MGGPTPARQPFLVEDRYRIPRLVGLFSADPAIQSLISAARAPAGPTSVAGLVPGVGLPEMLPPGVAQNLASAPPQITGVQADPIVYAIMQILQQIVEGFNAQQQEGGLVEGPQGVEGQRGGGGGGQQGGGGGGGGQQGGGGGGQQGGGGGGGGQSNLSPEFEADIEPLDPDSRYG